MITDNFYNNFMFIKKLKKVSYKDIEKVTGIPRSTVHYHANTRFNSIPLKMAVRLANYFNRSIDWFITNIFTDEDLKGESK